MKKKWLALLIPPNASPLQSDLLKGFGLSAFVYSSVRLSQTRYGTDSVLSAFRALYLV